jgi:uncharacterized beta-barrel protein YwiB (DUF1934 family)
MKQEVVLHIRGQQSYDGQEPEVIELMTEGTMEFHDGGWDISYEETELTGLSGVTTTFRVEPEKVILRRTGKLRSEMMFQQGVRHESLYQLDFGALLITVCAKHIEYDLSETAPGTVDLTYNIEIEAAAAGTVEYHLDVTPIA